LLLVAWVGVAAAQQTANSSATAQPNVDASTPSSNPAVSNPLVKLLQSKGIINEQEALPVTSAASRAESDELLARLLLSKGVITRDEYEQTLAASTADSAARPRPVPASLNAADSVTGAQPAEKASPATPAIASSPSKPGGEK